MESKDNENLEDSNSEGTPPQLVASLDDLVNSHLNQFDMQLMPNTPVLLSVKSLLKRLCKLNHASPEKQKQLLNTFYHCLVELKLTDELSAYGEFKLLEGQSEQDKYQLVIGMELINKLSRYHREFEEIDFIAGGGFGQVFKARHKLDNTEYAVKKITIPSVSFKNVLLHLAEVRTLASLNHQHIVPYKAAWVEPYLTSGQLAIEGSKDTESSCSKKSIPESSTDSSDFIQFKSQTNNGAKALKKRSISKNFICTYRSKRNQIKAEETESCVKLKWMTIYIQMSLCQMTLQDFLRKRNAHPHLENFYKKFTQKTNSVSSIKLKTPTHLDVALDMFNQLLNGLSYIHSRKIVHHDIKPGNIFVSVEPNGKIHVQQGDFGLSCLLQEPHDGEGFGTPGYAAPEQLRGECNFKSDIYSLGIILLELLVPFSTESELFRAVVLIREGGLFENIDNHFRTLIKKMIDPDFRKRPHIHDIQKRCVDGKDQLITDLAVELTRHKRQLAIAGKIIKRKNSVVKAMKMKLEQSENKSLKELSAIQDQLEQFKKLSINPSQKQSQKPGNNFKINSKPTLTRTKPVLKRISNPPNEFMPSKNKPNRGRIRISQLSLSNLNEVPEDNKE